MKVWGSIDIRHLQNAKEPEMMPFAMAVGKIMYANWVNGACNMKNNAGGITNLKLSP